MIFAMQIMLILLLLAVFTAMNVVTGIILLLWRKTRPFGFYAMLVEPGGVIGFLVAALLWREFLVLVLRYESPGPDWMVWTIIILAIILDVAGAVIGALSGFALATWLWWRFSPEPYRPKIENAYRSFVAGSFWYRPRWNTRKEPSSTLPVDPE